MTFNSFEYALFLPVVVLIYWRLNHKSQNVLLLVASYLFYAAWDWRFLSLLVVSTLTDFVVARRIESTTSSRARKALLTASLGVNLCILGFFKYYGFFVESALDLLERFGLDLQPTLLSIVLPVGISFYTFQTLSYTIDVYRGRSSAVSGLLTFAVYVSYFPQLVAGPIERAHRLMPQIQSRRQITVDSVHSGLALVLVGLFKKVVIADGAALFVEPVFSDIAAQSSLSLLIGVYAFALQIYGDFSGYTDIARGTSRLLGIELTHNFAQPYMSRSITEFWRRWHISLSGWLRDYLYIPLGGNRQGRIATYRNILMTMLLGGLWHGAAWTFVAWGGLHGVALIIHRLFLRGRKPNSSNPLRLADLGKVLITFHLVALLWVPFRSESIGQAWDYLAGLLEGRAGLIDSNGAILIVALGVLTVAVDAIQRTLRSRGGFGHLGWAPVGVSYGLMIVSVVIFSGGDAVPFIYFQF